MAYDSTRNYAQEINDLIAAGGDPAEVQRLLNERLEKQQGTNSEYSTYDDVYRSAMDYMASKGYTPVASANVDYAEIANQIMMDQNGRGVTFDQASDRSWADLGTVLDARQQKLNTGAYDAWKDSIAPGTDIAYNGDVSMDAYLRSLEEASYEELRQKYGQGQGKVIMTPTGYVGSGAAIGWGNDPAYESGQSLNFGRGTKQGYASVGDVASGVGTGAVVQTGNTQNNVNLGYSDEAWEKKQNRENAEAAVGETNAATRVPVQGENSSYVNANTNNAFEAAVQALMQGDDREGAQAMQNAWDRYGMAGLVDILMPGVSRDGYQSKVPVYGVYGGGSTGGGNVTTPVATTPTVTGGAVQNGMVDRSYLYPELTDAQKAVLRDTAAENGDQLFTYTGTMFDQSSLGSQTGDLSAEDLAVQIVSGGGSGSKGKTPDAEISPIKKGSGGQDTTMYYADTTAKTYEQIAEETDALYRQAYQQAATSGDSAAMSAILAEWNTWKQAMRRNLTVEQAKALGW